MMMTVIIIRKPRKILLQNLNIERELTLKEREREFILRERETKFTQ